MRSHPSANKPGAGLSLRERKKARTRAEIQRQALRLFQQQGYAETTVEQIADSAEVSPSTFFRYFPTKEDVVLWDDFDPLILEALRAQPPELSPLRALREALLAVWREMTPEELAEQGQRTALTASVPELRARALEQFTGTVQLLAEALAERTGRRPNDPAIRDLAGAVIGVGLAIMLDVIDDPSTNLVQRMDDALAHLEAGLPL